ncbi:four helix bundle protein [Porticoccus sp. W117]|uniref:four helix bundle protein n=1 Tax=Porticoccus sp. W117 TaxID=3054777 RepID=UPI0025983DCF|nr:four helix bundle protein [Porticoccus sp. W117]MDM3870142.1 four helix bundle protein [Porticoccus sp. W117]
MRFENLEVWKLGCRLSVEVFATFRELKDFGFKDQITRSALSVPSNIAEGFERDSEKEKARYLRIAKGSLGEFKTQTYIGIKIGYIPIEIGQRWLKTSEDLGARIGSLITKLTSISP